MPAIPRPSRRRFLPWMALAALAYVVSPVDLVPDLVPVLGFGDDAMVLLAVAAQAVAAYLAPKTSAPRPM
jgi:uncharacterized membrane protein YkvA (DUF1232 family)